MPCHGHNYLCLGPSRKPWPTTQRASWQVERSLLEGVRTQVTICEKCQEKIPRVSKRLEHLACKCYPLSEVLGLCLSEGEGRDREVDWVIYVWSLGSWLGLLKPVFETGPLPHDLKCRERQSLEGFQWGNPCQALTTCKALFSKLGAKGKTEKNKAWCLTSLSL